MTTNKHKPVKKKRKSAPRGPYKDELLKGVSLGANVPKWLKKELQKIPNQAENITQALIAYNNFKVPKNLKLPKNSSK